MKKGIKRVVIAVAAATLIVGMVGCQERKAEEAVQMVPILKEADDYILYCDAKGELYIRTTTGEAHKMMESGKPMRYREGMEAWG